MIEIGKYSIDVATIALGIFGLFQAVRQLPRYWRYRRVRRLLRLRSRHRTIIVCSELEQPEERQWVEPDEFIYMLKYGDIDALFEIVTIVRTVYPNLRLEVFSAQEAALGNLDYDCDMIVVGGPDYNFVAERIIEEGKASVTYDREKTEQDENSEGPIVLCAGGCEPWKGRHRNEDFGYIEVMENPFSHRGRLIMFGGCHTIGVTAAVRLLQLSRDGSGLTYQAKRNLKFLNRHARLRRRYGVIFRATLVGATIPAPNASEAHWFGDERKVFGIRLPWFNGPAIGPAGSTLEPGCSVDEVMPEQSAPNPAPNK